MYKIKKQFIMLITFIFLVLMLCNNVTASDYNLTDEQKTKITSIEIPFIENQGQIDNQVEYYTDTFIGRVYVTENGLTYALHNNESQLAVKETFKESNEVNVSGVDKSITNVNYFKGNTSKTNISTYNQVKCSNIYNNIDLNLKAYSNNIEKIFTVHTNGNPNEIWIEVDGSQELKINNQGELEILTALGVFKLTSPIAYQEINGKIVNISASYILRENTYGFSIGNYNKSYDLIIDPLLASTYIGGNQSDTSTCIALDQSGNVFVGGYTCSSDFPVTNSCLNPHFNKGDIFISKFNNDLTSLLASTYFGGSSFDSLQNMVLDQSGNLYFTGSTSSLDFPTTNGAYDTSYNNKGSYLFNDAFVSILNNDINTLLASTYIGGEYHDNGNAIILDQYNNIYITGSTGSIDFPSLIGSYDDAYNGADTLFISKFNSNLTSLLATTFIGNGYAADIAIDSFNNVFITGYTGATPFPTTPGAYDETWDGNNDIFVSKFNNNLTSLLASTILGSKFSAGRGIVIDNSNNVYIGGTTDIINVEFPTTSDAYDRTSNGGGEDVFISKFDNNLTSLLASTLLGGSNYDELWDMVMDQSQNIYFVVFTGSDDLPVHYDAYETKYGNGSIFIGKFNKELSDLIASTYFPSTIPRSIALDNSSNVYITGNTGSSNFPTTEGSYDKTFNGLEDSYVSKLDSSLLAPPKVISVDPKNNTVTAPNKIINITFNVPIKAGDAYNDIILKDSNNSTIPISKSINNNILLINPSNLLEETVNYTLILPVDSISILAGYGLEEDYNLIFKIDKTPPTATVNLPGGFYNTNLLINITATDNLDHNPTIYYTLNGTDPTISSTKYIAPISISEGITMLKFIAVDSTGSVSQIYNETYTIVYAFSVSQIESAASTVRAYIETYHKLPNTVNVSGTEISTSQFLELLTTALLQINSGTSNLTQLKSISGPVNPKEDIHTGNIYKYEYMKLAGDIKNYMDSTGKSPDYAYMTSIGPFLRFESLVYMYTMILDYHRTSGNIAGWAAMEPWSVITSKPFVDPNAPKFTVAQIEIAASTLRTYVETYHKLPNTIQVGSTDVSMSQFLELLTTALLQINSVNYNQILLRNFTDPVNPKEDIHTGNIYKSEYMKLASDIKNYMDSTGKTPGYAYGTSIGSYLRFESLVYMYAMILDYHRTSGNIAGWAAMEPWSDITSRPAIDPNAPYFSVDQINAAANTVVNIVENEHKLPDKITINGIYITMPQFLELLTTALLQINSGNNNYYIILRNFTAPLNPTEDINMGTIYKAEYMKLANDIKNYMDSTGKTPDYAYGTSIGPKLRFENIVYMYSMILDYYHSSGMIVEGAEMVPWSMITSIPIIDPNAPKFTVDQIKIAASTVRHQIETNHNLPDKVTINGTDVKMPQFLELLTTALINICTGNSSAMPLMNFIAPTNPKETIWPGNIYQEDYLYMAAEIKYYMDLTGKSPDYAYDTSIGPYLRYENLVYMYTMILDYYNTSGWLADWAAMKPWAMI